MPSSKGSSGNGASAPVCQALAQAAFRKSMKARTRIRLAVFLCHTRLSNSRVTLRDSGSLRGWGDPHGYLPDEHRFYYLTDVQRRD